MGSTRVAGTVVHDEDLAAIRNWFERLAELVRDVDFVPARQLFDEGLLVFGSITDFVAGQRPAEEAQWRQVWPTIDGFAFRDDIRALVSPDRLFAVGLAIFDSTGYDADGSTFSRRGRATVSFVRDAVGDPWIGNHTHMSLFRGTPALSHGSRASKS